MAVQGQKSIPTRLTRWPGLIEHYRRFLPVSDATPIVTLNEGDRLRHTVEHFSRVNIRSLMLSDDCFTADADRVERYVRILEEEAPGIGVRSRWANRSAC